MVERAAGKGNLSVWWDRHGPLRHKMGCRGADPAMRARVIRPHRLFYVVVSGRVFLARPTKENSLTGPVENSPRILNSLPPVRLPFGFFPRSLLRTIPCISTRCANEIFKTSSHGIYLHRIAVYSHVILWKAEFYTKYLYLFYIPIDQRIILTLELVNFAHNGQDRWLYRPDFRWLRNRSCWRC